MEKNSVQQIVIQLRDKAEIERLACIINLGICAAIESGALSIEEAEYYLYSPYTIEQLEKLGVAQDLIDVVHLGTELEDVKSLIPKKLDDSIKEIRAETIKFLKSMHSAPSSSFPRKKWVQAS